MRRYSPEYYSPRRGYEIRGRSPPLRRAYGGGGYGRRRDPNSGSLLVRNIPLDCRPEELRAPFERYGVVRDVYLPKDYYSGEPRGFAFIQFVDPYDALEAQRGMHGQIFAGREISVVVAAETRKRPEEMRRRMRNRGQPSHGGRSLYYGRSYSVSRSRSPPCGHGPHSRYYSKSYSPSPKRQGLSVSPGRRHVYHSRSPRDDFARDCFGSRDHRSNGNISEHQLDDGRDWRSPSRSRSGSADLSGHS